MAWMLYVLATGTLISVAALALDTMLRRMKRPTRWVWVAALGGIAALAVIAPRSSAPVAISHMKVSVASSQVVPTVVTTPDLLFRLAQLRELAASAATTAMRVVETRGADVALPLAVAWAVATTVLLSLLVIVTRRANLARRHWPRADVQGVPVRVAPMVGPAVIGVARPDIVIPRWLTERPADEQRLVVVHEREHVAARDQLLPLGAWIVVALLPWHPAVWWSMSRLRLAIELDCDARVLHRGVQPRSYGSLLIDIAGQCAGHRIGALALADRPSHLERRLLAMKDSSRRIGFARAAALTAVAGLSVLMACEARLPTSAELDRMDVASIQKAAVDAKLVAADSVSYYVNDVHVTASDAKKLTAKQIAEVRIAKGAKDQMNEVRIITDSAARHFKVKSDMLLRDSTRGELREVPAVSLRMTTKDDASAASAPLVYIDGVLSTKEALAKLPMSAIATVNVLKGASATEFSTSPFAKNGIIQVTTKR